MGYVSESFAELLKIHFLSLHVANVLMGISVGVEVPILTMLGRQLGHNEKEIANFVAILSLCRMLPGIPIGLISECIDVRYVMLFTAVLHVAGCALVFLLLPKDISLWIFSVFNGISIGGFFLTRHIYVSLVTKRIYRGITFSFFAGSLRWAHVFGPIMLGAAATFWSDGRYYIFVPLITGLIAVICLIVDNIVFYIERLKNFANVEENETALCESTELLPDTPKENTDITNTSQEESAALPSYNSITEGNSGSQKEASGLEIYLNIPESQECGAVMGKQNDLSFFHEFWLTMSERWFAIWRLGVYIILYVALRANRKLLLTFAAMRINLSDSQLAFLLSFSFLFDATLFPIGGFISDLYGRRWAMVPAVLGIGITFMLLPLLHTPLWLYVMAGAFGAADALGCGLILTLVADHAPKKFMGPFFGVMRTVQDTGHFLASTVVSAIILRIDFAMVCFLWGAVSFGAALWALFIVRFEL